MPVPLVWISDPLGTVQTPAPLTLLGLGEEAR